MFLLQVVLALANLAGESPISRDLVLRHGALMPLLSQIRKDAKLSMLISATWALSNFYRGNPRPPFEQMKLALPALKFLVDYDDEKVLAYSCCALSYMYGGMNYEIQAVIDADICEHLLELIMDVVLHYGHVFFA
ncbi:hypothetical protein OSB04_013882 [Centaurea solstitialis]|uniref:Uncharacterized protein n=1 Tax=Centaurea solstitialis TaxID=347529 RepID=A0AA38TYT5_9ASTR|nr:hypothetical protein OSB04_013882 [Centaurea solstitialis]